MTPDLVDEPTDALTNGQVTLELTISDEVTELGILTELTGIDSEGSKVTDELREHILDEYRIDVTEHGIGVFD